MTTDDLAARAEIQDLIARYAVAIDTRDFHAVRACFAEGARATYGGVESPSGRDAIVDWLAANLTAVASTHLLAPPLIELHSDRAETVTAAIAVLIEERRRARRADARPPLLRPARARRRRLEDHSPRARGVVGDAAAGGEPTRSPAQRLTGLPHAAVVQTRQRKRRPLARTAILGRAERPGAREGRFGQPQTHLVGEANRPRPPARRAESER